MEMTVREMPTYSFMGNEKNIRNSTGKDYGGCYIQFKKDIMDRSFFMCSPNTRERGVFAQGEALAIFNEDRYNTDGTLKAPKNEKDRDISYSIFDFHIRQSREGSELIECQTWGGTNLEDVEAIHLPQPLYESFTQPGVNDTMKDMWDLFVKRLPPGVEIKPFKRG